jgi:hypothetical protein
MPIRHRFPATRQLRRDGAPVSERARLKRRRHAGSEAGIPVARQSAISKTRAFPARFLMRAQESSPSFTQSSMRFPLWLRRSRVVSVPSFQDTFAKQGRRPACRRGLSLSDSPPRPSAKEEAEKAWQNAGAITYAPAGSGPNRASAGANHSPAALLAWQTRRRSTAIRLANTEPNGAL